MLHLFTFHVSKSIIISPLLIPTSPNPNLYPIRFFQTPKRFACIYSPKPSMSSSTPTHVEAEYAKSGNSSCKKCSEPIENQALRLGIKDARGYTKWHHLGCFSFGSESVASVDVIQGFESLKSSDQEALKAELEKPKDEDSSGKKSSQSRKVHEVDEAEDENEVGKRELKKPKGSSAAGHVEAEYAKSGRSSCKKCSEPIEKEALRLGAKDARGYTMWHHLACFSFGSESVASVDKIEGFQSLKSNDQEALKILADKFEKSKEESSDQEALKAELEKPKDEDSSGKKSSQKQKVREVKEAEDENDVGKRELKKPKKGSSAATHVEAEYAKSGRSSCKKCLKPIEKSTLRLGFVTRDPRGFDATKWHHLGCFSFGSESITSVDKIKGFQSLKSSDQEALKNLADAFEKSKEEDPNGGKSSEKQKVCEVDEDENEVGERELKKAKVSNLEISFSVSDVKDKYKDATLPPKWKAFQTIIFLERDDGLHDSSKIAAFDFDGCLANTDVRRVGAEAWSLMYPSIPDKLQALYEDGYKLVIFSNEANIEHWKNKRQAAVDSKIGRLNDFIKKVKVPIQVFIACGPSRGEDPFRKPKPGMWHILEQHFNSGISIDMDQSFYVGDAAGRSNDHSDADLKFAEANGLKFHVPEDYFGV